METMTSNSIGITRLNQLEESPRKFLSEILKATETEYFGFGTLVHCLVLQPETFQEKYAVTEGIPEGKYAKACEYLAQVECGNDVNSWFRSAIEYAELKGKDETLIPKLKDLMADPKSYYNVLLNTKNKTIITLEDYTNASNCALEVRKNPKICVITEQRADGYAERLIKWKIDGFDFNIESTPDYFYINVLQKKVDIYDLKTTKGSPYSFESSYERYKYYRQAAFYQEAVAYFMKNELRVDPSEFKFNSYLVPVQSGGLNECAIYKVSKEDILIGQKEVRELLSRLEWHVKTQNWDYPREWYEDDVPTLRLKSDEI